MYPKTQQNKKQSGTLNKKDLHQRSAKGKNFPSSQLSPHDESISSRPSVPREPDRQISGFAEHNSETQAKHSAFYCPRAQIAAGNNRAARTLIKVGSPRFPKEETACLARALFPFFVLRFSWRRTGRHSGIITIVLFPFV